MHPFELKGQMMTVFIWLKVAGSQDVKVYLQELRSCMLLNAHNGFWSHELRPVHTIYYSHQRTISSVYSKHTLVCCFLKLDWFWLGVSVFIVHKLEKNCSESDSNNIIFRTISLFLYLSSLMWIGLSSRILSPSEICNNW